MSPRRQRSGVEVGEQTDPEEMREQTRDGTKHRFVTQLKLILFFLLLNTKVLPGHTAVMQYKCFKVTRGYDERFWKQTAVLFPANANTGLCVCVCVIFDLHEADSEDTAEPVPDEWSLMQESIAADTSVEHSVSHTEPPLPWNTTWVRKDLHPMRKASFSVNTYLICYFLFSHISLCRRRRVG